MELFMVLIGLLLGLLRLLMLASVGGDSSGLRCARLIGRVLRIRINTLAQKQTDPPRLLLLGLLLLLLLCPVGPRTPLDLMGCAAKRRLNTTIQCNISNSFRLLSARRAAHLNALHCRRTQAKQVDTTTNGECVLACLFARPPGWLAGNCVCVCVCLCVYRSYGREREREKMGRVLSRSQSGRNANNAAASRAD